MSKDRIQLSDHFTTGRLLRFVASPMAKLRAAGVPEPEKLLNTVWGVGYRWKSED